MSRLTHSFGGYRRYMQMSRAQVFAFVEGKSTDPYFYGRLCESECSPAGIGYEVSQARELPGNTGGKGHLLAFFTYLRRQSSLMDDFQGKTTCSIFFLDKDVDDLLRKQKKSRHIVYTRYYDVENHVFRDGDLINAIAAAASLDISFVQRQIGDISAWRRSAAETWKEWVKLCLFARLRRIGSDCNYSAKSRINSPLVGSVDPTARAEKLSLLEKGYQKSPQQFRRSFRGVSKFVDDLYSRGQHDLIFKGKWYAFLLAEEVVRRAPNKSISANGLADRIAVAAAMSLDFSAPWAAHFRERISELVSDLSRRSI